MRIFNLTNPARPPPPPVPLFNSFVSPTGSSQAGKPRHIDEALNRTPTGRSITEPGSVFWPENGRTYHGYKEGKYFLPNDAAEQDRLDFQHACFLIMTGGVLALAPIKTPRNVLDIGTGTGIWAINFAEQNPMSHVIGTDLSAIQPDVGGLPNCEFVKDDMEEEWIGYPSFDYIHLRNMFTCFDDAREVMRQAYQNLSPGGWIEYQDIVTEIHQENPDFKNLAHQRWLRAIIEGAAMMGRDIQVTRKYRAWLIEEGFLDIVERKVKVPIGPWSDDPQLRNLGNYMSRNLRDAARGTPWKLLRGGGLSVAEVDALVLEVKQELQDKRNHSFLWVNFIWGRKPFPGETGPPS